MYISAMTTRRAVAESEQCTVLLSTSGPHPHPALLLTGPPTATVTVVAAAGEMNL